MHCKYLPLSLYKPLEKFSKALYGTKGGTYSARIFRPVMLAIYVRLALASCLYKQVRYREHGQKFLASLGRRCIFLHFSASSCSSSSSQLNRSNKSVFLLQSCFTERVNGCVDDAFFVQLSKATLVEDTPFCTTQSLNQHFP